MTTLTLPLIAVWLVTLWARRPLLAVAAGGMTPTGAFLVAGSIALPTLYASILFVLVVEVVSPPQRGRRPPAPVITVLWLFALVVVVVTVLAPFLFPGELVATLGSAPHTLGSAGFLTSSNQAQMLYLLLDVALAAVAARRPREAFLVLYLALAGATVLSLWRYLGINAGVPYPFGFFDDSPGFRYIDGAPGDIVRFRGVFSEPAALATSTLTCFAASLALLPRLASRGWRIAVALVAAASLFELLQSTSASGIIAAAILAVAAIVVWIADWTTGHSRRRPATLIAVVAGALVLLALLPPITDYLAAVVNSKVGTSSFDERSGNDALSYKILLDTFGVGVGVGANRPSSFLASLVASTGLVGSALFLGVLVWTLQRCVRIEVARPVSWVVASVLVVKFISSPDLSDTTGVLWLAIGVAAGWAHGYRPVRRGVLRLPPRHRSLPAPAADEVEPAAGPGYRRGSRTRGAGGGPGPIRPAAPTRPASP